MRLLHLAFVLLGICGMALVVSCSPPEKPKVSTPPPPPPKAKFCGTVSVAKTNGVVTDIGVRLPSNDISVKNKPDLELLIRTLEVMAADLKVISDQMEIEEKSVEKSHGQTKIPTQEKVPAKAS